MFFCTSTFFRIGIRDLKRYEHVTRSPLYSHIAATVHGIYSVRAYNKQDEFMKKFMLLFDQNQGLLFMFNCAIRWLAVRMDMLSVLVTTMTALLIVILHGVVGPSFAGLALAFAMQLSGIFQFTVRALCETESRFTSVQRLLKYINVSFALKHQVYNVL